MVIEAFDEVVELTLYRNRKRNKGIKHVKEVAELLGKSGVWTRQVIDGHQSGPAGQADKRKIAEYLGIFLAS